jgi:hypothetical protein
LSGASASLRKVIPALAVTMLVTALLLVGAGPARAANAVPPANDAEEKAEVIKGDSLFVRGDNTSATRERGESDHILSGVSVGENSVWYRWTAWKSGPFEVNVCESRPDTVLAVYEKQARGKLKKLADNDDGCFTGNQRGSSLVFEAEFEETYLIAVSGYSKASEGPFTLRLAPDHSSGQS